jgi:diketogulonate reductase-like aldo/keto reductase
MVLLSALIKYLTGTTKIKNLDDNIGSLKVKLSKEDLEEITNLVKENEVSGKRTFFNHEHITWRFANTPPVNISVKKSESK